MIRDHDDDEILAANHLTQRYGSTLALDDVSISVRRGQGVGIVGESGAGKSTLLRLLLGLERPDGGLVTFLGEPLGSSRTELKIFRRAVQVVFQDPRSSLDPRMTVAQTVMEPLRALRIGQPDTRRARVHDVLDWVGLTESQSRRRPGELSGGQRQRVAIARALAPGPDLIIGDEPVSALDVSIRAQILDLLAELQAELGLTLLLVSHDVSVVARLCAHTVVLHDGRVVEAGPTSRVLTEPTAPYTRELLAAVPVLR